MALRQYVIRIGIPDVDVYVEVDDEDGEDLGELALQMLRDEWLVSDLVGGAYVKGHEEE